MAATLSRRQIRACRKIGSQWGHVRFWVGVLVRGHVRDLEPVFGPSAAWYFLAKPALECAAIGGCPEAREFVERLDRLAHT